MNGKHIAGIVVVAFLGAVIAAGHGGLRSEHSTARPAITDTPAIIVAGCETYGGGIYIVTLGGANEYGCPGTGVPLHGVPMPNSGYVRNLRVTGDAFGNALEGSVITVYLNGSPTALSCTVSATGICQDEANTVKVKPGDELGATFLAPNADEMTMSLEVCLSDNGTGCS